MDLCSEICKYDEGVEEEHRRKLEADKQARARAMERYDLFVQFSEASKSPFSSQKEKEKQEPGSTRAELVNSSSFIVFDYQLS